MFFLFFQIYRQLDMIRRWHLYNLLLLLFGSQVGVFQMINSRGLSRHGVTRKHVETFGTSCKSMDPPPKKQVSNTYQVYHIMNIYEPTVPSLFGGSMMALKVFSLPISTSFSPRGSHRTRWMAIGWHLFAETGRWCWLLKNLKSSKKKQKWICIPDTPVW